MWLLTADGHVRTHCTDAEPRVTKRSFDRTAIEAVPETNVAGR
jgi:hypothetical protein